MRDKKLHTVKSHFLHREFWMLGAIAALMLIGVGLDVADEPLYEAIKGWLVAGLALVLLYASVPALVRCGSTGGIKSVWSVMGYSLMLLILTLFAFFLSYYWIVSALPKGSPPPSDKVLNFPPVIAALWAAGMGWYVHFQATSKNHRTTNAFNLLMQTRTSKEFLDRARSVQEVYPFGAVIPEDETQYFSSAALRDLIASKAAAKVAEQTTGAVANFEDLERKVLAANNLKYLLNYYEFMAVGIAARDL